LVHVHVELRAAARHPYVQGKHVQMPAREDLVADLNDQLVALIVEPLAGMVRVGRGFLQNRVRANHLARNQVLTHTGVLERTLGLSAPKPVGSNFYVTEAVGFCANVWHVVSLSVPAKSSIRPGNSRPLATVGKIRFSGYGGEHPPWSERGVNAACDDLA